MPRLRLRPAIRLPRRKLKLMTKQLMKRRRPLLQQSRRLIKPGKNSNAFSKRPLRLMRLED